VESAVTIQFCTEIFARVQTLQNVIGLARVQFGKDSIFVQQFIGSRVQLPDLK
jgi:hypothetical protein